MRTLVYGFAGVASVLFSGVAHADELTDRYIAACMSHGDNLETCSCSADAMQATFSAPQFSQVVTALEAGGPSAVGEAIETIMQSQPELVSVFKSEILVCS